MADQVGEDALLRVSASAAEQFTDAYYNALHGARGTLSTYYAAKNVLPSGRLLPSISYNGQNVTDPEELQALYQNQMPFTYFEVQSVNAHVLNPSLTPLDASAKPKEQQNNMSILVQVSGYVRLIERKDGPLRGFSDTLVLVPNKEEVGAKGKGKTGEGRSWVIQSQNFRFVV